MKAGLSRRDLFARLARAFQPPAPLPPAAPRAASTADRVAIIQGRHCLALTSFCAACVERCPVEGAMQVRNGMPMVVADLCTGCGICHRVCPAPTNAVLLMPRRRLQPNPNPLRNPGFAPASL